jgi:hypothetical protein
LRKDTPGAVLEAFPTDTSPESLKKAFEDIKSNESFKGLKLRMAVYSVKHSSRKPFMEETYEVSARFRREEEVMGDWGMG